MSFRPVFYVTGLLLLVLAASMTLPLLVDLAYGNNDWHAFLTCQIFTAFIGGILVLTHHGIKFTLSVRQTFVLTTMVWVALSACAALPFALSGLKMSIADSVFEAVSGITTTGATVITGLDSAPPGILIWRAMLQWLGGIGIIVMALSVLPLLKVGGMQLFRTESSEKQKAFPRAVKLATGIAYLYLGLTIICAICYGLAGMDMFNAVAHAMTTIATGGFSTFDSSFGHYDSPREEIVAIVFMLMSALPFVLYLRFLHGDRGALFQDTQVRTFLSVVALSVITLTTYLVMQGHLPLGESLRRASFNVVSLITGTGYVNHDYGLWGAFGIGFLMFMMVMGGCAGSTTCGIKIFRFQVLVSVAVSQIKSLLHPHGVFPPRFNGHILPNGVATSVLSFFFLFAASFVVVAIVLAGLGLDYITALSGALTSLANVGPGMGDIIGASGTFKPLPDGAKWVMSFAMILGRLELMTVLVLFLPTFWRR